MKIEDMEYGYCFHIYLRKMTDTDWSVILWNYIVILCDIDADDAKDSRVWSHFCNWCDKKWKENPETPFYDVAIKWAKEDHDDLAYTGRLSAFKMMIKLACEETRDDLNYSAKYDLKN